MKSSDFDPETIFNNIRSEALANLRFSITHLNRLNLDLGTIAQFTLVVDTNIVIKELLWLTQGRRNPNARSDLMEVLEANTVRLCAPPTLFAEVEEKIPLVSLDRDANERTMLEHWEYFKSRIELVLPNPELTKVLRSGVDPNDAEFVALEETIGAAGILSKDPHIRMMGGNQISLECIFYLRNYSRNAAIEMTIKVAGTHLMIAGVNGIGVACRAARTLVQAYSRLPDWIKISIVVGGLLALSNPRARTAIASVTTRLAAAAGTVSTSAIDLVTTAAGCVQNNQALARENLDRALVELANQHEQTGRAG
jgi:predicted nucleic acid-binding protein